MKRPPTKTLGDYLLEAEPVAALWLDLVHIVYLDSPRIAHPERLESAAKTLFDVGCFEGEMINGGMSQFFSNSAGNRAQESLAALRRVGASLCAELLAKGITIFPGGVVPEDRHSRCNLLFQFEEREPQFLEDLTQVFYQRVIPSASIPAEDLITLQLEFMRQHREERVVAS